MKLRENNSRNGEENYITKSKEFGGYMQMEYNCGNEYHSGFALNTGANCLVLLINNLKIKRLYIPYLLCGRISSVCEENNVEYIYYSLDRDLLPVGINEMDEGEFLYLVNYYGLVSQENILLCKKLYKNIILDNVQDFFTYPMEGIPTIYSCRKYFGVPDGAYLCCDSIWKEKFESLEYESSFNRAIHLMGRFEQNGQIFYSDYRKNEEYLEKSPLRKMSLISQNILRGIDYNMVIQKRNNNFDYINRLLNSYNRLTVHRTRGPFMYPLMIPGAEKLRVKLQSRKVYIPLLWEEVFNFCGPGTTEYEYANNIIALPIDQRYNVEDMLFLSEIVINELSNL